MDVLHAALRKIRQDPDHPTSQTLTSLIRALDSGEQFELAALYHLNYNDFGLAVDLMKQWRLDSFRYERGWASRAATARGPAELDLPQWMNTGRSRAPRAS
jgi:hypothetical protein